MAKNVNNISIKEFKDFLKHHGLNYHRTSSGHEIWGKSSLTRPVTFQIHIDPVPLFILKTNLRTMGLTLTDLRGFFDSGV
jgi:hypothetical protein